MDMGHGYGLLDMGKLWDEHGQKLTPERVKVLVLY